MMDSPRSLPASANGAAQSFQVYLRLRPNSPQSSISGSRFITTAPGNSHIYVTPPSVERNRSKTIEKFLFTRVFGEDSEQRDVFEETVLPLLEDAVTKGQDGTLATLGVTGSGKTHTVLGSKNVRGMTQMALDVLFSSISDRIVDFSKVDFQTLDNTEAFITSTASFYEKLSNAADSYTSKHTSVTHITTPRTPNVSDITIDLSDSKSRYAILLSMYELYNDRIFDLLDESVHSPNGRRKALIFKKPSTISTWDTSREQKKVVSGLRKIHARTLQEALQVIEHGQATRTVSSTSSNSTSSRSHAFLQIEIKRFSPRYHERSSACIHIVDLAGSERARTAKTAGERLAEAGSINRSLMCLGQCLQLQTQISDNGKPAVVPWRQSKLTELLFSNSFSGAGCGHRTSMIVTADAMGDFNATSQILRYSALAREVALPRTPSRAVSETSISSVSDNGVMVLVDGTTEPSLALGGEKRKDAVMARLLAQLQEADARARNMEDRWKEAEGRCLFVEQTVREEVTDEMEGQLDEMRREMMERLDTEIEWREGYVDEKIEIFKRGIQVHEDALPGALERIEELEDENERLRREIFQLRREVNNRSPSKQHKGARLEVRPLKDVLNLDAFRQLALELEGDR